MENQVTSFVDALPDIVWTALPDGNVDFLNQPWYDYTGLGGDNAYGQSWQAAIHPADLAELLDRWRAILASGERGDVQVRIRRFDGEYRQFLFRARPITDPSGQVVKWCGMTIDIEDQRQAAEEALRASEGHFRTIADSIPAQIAVMTPDGDLEGVNRQLLEYVGATLEELKGRTLGHTVHPDDAPLAVRAWKRSVATGGPYDTEHRIRRTDGIYRWFHVRGLPVKDDDGRVSGWYLLQTDVDDRRRAEALLAGEKRLLEMVTGSKSMPEILEALCQLVESTASGCYCGVALLDPSGRRLELGAAPSLPSTFITSVIGRPVSVESGPSAMAAYLNQQVIAPDLTSETRWVSTGWRAMALRHGLRACWSTPFTSSAGKVLGVFGIYYDEPKTPTPLQQNLIEQFTHIASIAVERAQSDAALKSSEARKAAILDSALDSIVTIDHKGCITEFNPAAERTFGFGRDQVLGQQLADVIIPLSVRDQYRQGFARYLTTGDGRVLGRHIEMTAVRADGREFPAELAITRIFSDGPPSFTGYLRDITERKQSVDERDRAQARLEGEKRLLEMVASGYSLRDVLNALCSFVEDTATECSCGVYLIDWSGPTFHHAAAPSVPATFYAPIDGAVLRDEIGPCAIAARLKTQVIAADIESDLQWKDTIFRTLALANGFKSCWSTPIYSLAGTVLGTFALYQRTPASPTPLQLDLIAQVTHIASIAIERAQSDAALTRSEARKAAILDSALDCIVTIDQEGCITEFNPAAERTFGYPRDQVLGQQLADVVIPPSLREEHRRGFVRYLATGEAAILGRRVEMTAIRADGSEFPAELAITRIPVDWPPSFTGYLRDITELKRSIDERKQAETRLASENRLLEMVASGSSLPEVLNTLCSFVEHTAGECYCGVYLIDWSGPRFQKGIAPTLPASFNDPIEGLPVSPDIGPCGRAACLKTQVIAVDLELDPLWQYSPLSRLALAHGLRSGWSTPIYSLAGHVLGTFALFQRITASPTPLQQDLIKEVTHIARIAIERAQGEAALRRSEAFLAEAQRLSLTGSFSWRVATDELTWSEQAYRIYEFEPGSPVTFDRIASRVHPDDLPLLSDWIDRTRREGADWEFESRVQMPDASVKYVHNVAHATRDPDGNVEYIGAMQDVTERRLSEEALANARSELTRVARVTSLGALTASIAHEVNQPLSGIITNASTCLRMLGADPPNVDGARETARRTIRDGNRASEVITRLRALFSNKRTAAESMDLNEATQEVIALLRSELRSNRVILRTELADDLPPLTADRIQLQQVILNLLLNASDAMSGVEDRPRQLLVRTEREGENHVRLTVQDAGVGLDPQSLDKLFEAFYTTKAGGMGIGLSVSRSIIEHHHGHLWAVPNDGPGATFAFSIPQMSEDVTGARSPDDISSAAGMRGAHVAVST